ncbi:hypothetical protein F5X96DRAFT_685696 [Biscogniauxia mediterranea]|nr:hypothetical protein F5X96DRAFT_685696 [Biscogniauxia mediterranea]
MVLNSAKDPLTFLFPGSDLKPDVLKIRLVKPLLLLLLFARDSGRGPSPIPILLLPARAHRVLTTRRRGVLSHLIFSLSLSLSLSLFLSLFLFSLLAYLPLPLLLILTLIFTPGPCPGRAPGPRRVVAVVVVGVVERALAHLERPAPRRPHPLRHVPRPVRLRRLLPHAVPVHPALLRRLVGLGPGPGAHELRCQLGASRLLLLLFLFLVVVVLVLVLVVLLPRGGGGGGGGCVDAGFLGRLVCAHCESGEGVFFWVYLLGFRFGLLFYFYLFYLACSGLCVSLIFSVLF